MLRGYWLSFFAACGLILAAQVQAQGVSHDAGSKRRTTGSEAKPKADAPPSIPVAVQYDIHRVARALEAANDREPSSTDERNAKAQEKVADWTPWLFFLGAAEILVTAGGVWLVYRTLYHTRRAAEAAWGTLELDRLQRLPDLRISIPGGEIARAEETLLRQLLRIGVANAGETQAVLVSYCLTSTVGEALPAKPVYPAAHTFAGGLDTVIEPHSSLTYPMMKGWLSEPDFRDVIGGQRRLWVYGFFRYREKLYKETHTQRFGAVLQIQDEAYRRMALLPPNFTPGYHFSFEAIPDAYNRRVKDSS